MYTLYQYMYVYSTAVPLESRDWADEIVLSFVQSFGFIHLVICLSCVAHESCDHVEG